MENKPLKSVVKLVCTVHEIGDRIYGCWEECSLELNADVLKPGDIVLNQDHGSVRHVTVVEITTEKVVLSVDSDKYSVRINEKGQTYSKRFWSPELSLESFGLLNVSIAYYHETSANSTSDKI